MTKWLIATVTALLCVPALAQTAQPLLQPHQYFLDGSGNPCAGCSLFSYQAGTTTPLATYTTSAETTPNPNPVPLDAAGGATIWLGSSPYKFVLVDTFGTTLWTVDNVQTPTQGGTAYLPLTGGTLTGPLTATYFQFASPTLNACTSGQFVSGWTSAGWTCSVPSVGGTAGGDLSGTYPNPTVKGINGGTVPLNVTVLGTDSSGKPIAQAGTIANNTTGNAATATALAATPTQCTGSLFATGIAANGDANCGTPGTAIVQAVRLTSGVCTTGSSSYDTCVNTLTWPSAFADTAYSVSCIGISPSDPRAVVNAVNLKTTTTVQTQIVTEGSVAVTFSEIDCIGVHP